MKNKQYKIILCREPCIATSHHTWFTDYTTLEAALAPNDSDIMWDLRDCHASYKTNKRKARVRDIITIDTDNEVVWYRIRHNNARLMQRFKLQDDKKYLYVSATSSGHIVFDYSEEAIWNKVRNSYTEPYIKILKISTSYQCLAGSEMFSNNHYEEDKRISDEMFELAQRVSGIELYHQMMQYVSYEAHVVDLDGTIIQSYWGPEIDECKGELDFTDQQSLDEMIAGARAGLRIFMWVSSRDNWGNIYDKTEMEC